MRKVKDNSFTQVNKLLRILRRYSLKICLNTCDSGGMCSSINFEAENEEKFKIFVFYDVGGRKMIKDFRKKKKKKK